MKKLVLASNNPGKLEEIKALLGARYEILTMADFDLLSPAETGTTFLENAIIKARYVSQQTGLPALADDSGLCVKALQGAPGVYSSRYAGVEGDAQANLAKLLMTMQNVPPNERQAYFYCVVVMMQSANDPTPLIGQGQWAGHILTETRGMGGFGYDAIFEVAGSHRSAAELPPEEKRRNSHRAQALNQLIAITTCD